MVDLLLVILLSVLMAVALYLWLGSIWACVAALSFVAAICVWMCQCANVMTQIVQLEVRESVTTLKQSLDKFDGKVVIRLHSLLPMAKFIGEQSFPNFMNAVKSFDDAQEGELRKKAQRESEERSFKDTLDEGVRDARVEREKEANTAREASRRSHQTQ
jgi:hypothetical protein